MMDEFVLILLIIVLSILIRIISKLLSFMKRFFNKTRGICQKMDSADSYKEYLHWRKALRCHYLSLLPFVTEKNVMHIYPLVFRKQKHVKETKEERKDSIGPLLMPSVLGICTCLICICGMTWAWYSANIQSPAQKMTAAYYEISVESVTDAENHIVTPTDGSYALTAGQTYTIVLKAGGSVKNCGGYCRIENADASAVFYTQTFAPEETLTIQLTPEKSGAYTFISVWGSLPTGVDFITDSGKTSAETTVSLLSEQAETTAAEIHSEENTVYTVKSGDTLSDIAKRYGTTAEKLAAYNGLTDNLNLQVGQVLKIPPKDYELTAVSQESVSEESLSQRPVDVTVQDISSEDSVQAKPES